MKIILGAPCRKHIVEQAIRQAEQSLSFSYCVIAFAYAFLKILKNMAPG